MTNSAPYLVADVGGTNTRLALSDGDALRGDTIRRLRNDDFATFDAALDHYRREVQETPCGIAVAIAGPVSGNEGRLTNRPWQVAASGLRDLTGAGTSLVINDLRAQALGLPEHPSDLLDDVRPGTVAPEGARLVVNVGTGLNIATVWPGPFVASAEAGHITLPLRGAEQAGLSRFLEAENGFASAEEILSGRGLGNLHRWRTGKTVAPSEISAAAGDGDQQAMATCALFSRLLGQYAGDLALVQLAFGGVYLVGGVARSVLSTAQTRREFAAGFIDKGRFGAFLAPIPGFIVMDDYAPLRGLARALRNAG